MPSADVQLYTTIYLVTIFTAYKQPVASAVRAVSCRVTVIHSA